MKFYTKKIVNELLNEIFEINNEITEKYGISNIDFYANKINFCSKHIGATYSSPTELKDYWIKYLFYYPDICIDKSKALTRIIESFLGLDLFGNYLMKYNSCDFDEAGKFIMTYPEDEFSELSITVPTSLDVNTIKFAIMVIEKITTSRIKNIYLWHFTHQLADSSILSEVKISVSKINLNQPFISAKQFISEQFSNQKKWYLEIPEFNRYVQDIESKNL
ncbi:hypothetical protein [Ferruginibacter sp.]|nr:hypothetical protein [Ferruginibacter sp.]